MADLIERYKITANLPSVMMNYCNKFNSKQIKLITEMIYELENSIESADVQLGRWIRKFDGDIYEYYECSECGNTGSCETLFCPHCGARMEGEQNE